MSRPIRCIIFDFDGVLADTEDLHCAAFQAIAATLGTALTRERYYRELLGLPDRDCLAALIKGAGQTADEPRLDALVASKRERYAELARRAGLYPGVRETLEALHPHFALAVASGAFGDEIAAVLDRNGVRGLFAAVVGAEDVRAGKPAPDPFLEALRRINAGRADPFAASQCLVVEDSPLGIAAARAAGMLCIAVATSHGREALDGADHIIDGTRELQLDALSAWLPR